FYFNKKTYHLIISFVLVKRCKLVKNQEMPIYLIIIFIIVLILIIISTVLYFIQDRIIFHAEKLPTNYKFSFRTDFDEINLKTVDNQTLNGLLFKVNNPKGVILFFHNHSGNIEHWSRSANYINHLKYDALLMDFRGYGKSTGAYNEKLMYEDSKLWYDFTKDLYNEHLITVYGRGIGASFATYVSSLNNPKRLILESPMYNLLFTSESQYPYIPFKGFISKYKFNTAAYIKNVKCKIYIVHGKLNTLVDYRNSLKLYELAKDNTDLLIIPDGNHYNLVNHKMYLDKVEEILQ
ncbi:MAG: alpha/beta hydrolase, partial [Flavobacteriaceae bacterium]|nr:alpha/beta hydrolase [Flavobacteriaceae bacterium]